MKQENKVLIKKLMALIVSVALIIGVFPSNVFADTSLSAELVDYEETYYNGFNSDIAAATGTIVEVYDEADDESYYFLLDEPLERISGESIELCALFDYDIHGYYAELTYKNGSVYLDVYEDETKVISSQKLYTPKYVNLSQMPTISYNSQVTVTNGEALSCERYYKVDKSSLPNITKAFTFIADSDREEDDTILSLYDEDGELLSENDDNSAVTEGSGLYSALLFKNSTDTELILGVKSYDYDYGYYLDNTKLKLVAGVDVTGCSSSNGNELNVFYKGFGDDILFATGTQIRVNFSDGTSAEKTFNSYSGNSYETNIAGVNVEIYRGSDGAVYADYGVSFGEYKTAKLYTPTIKPVTAMPLLTKGTCNVNSLGDDGAGNYYRITAGNQEEKWKIRIAYAGDYSNDTYRGYLSVYDTNGMELDWIGQEWNDQDRLTDAEIEFVVPAGTTRVISVYDWSDNGQPYRLTVYKNGDSTPDTPPAPSNVTPTPQKTATVAVPVIKTATKKKSAKKLTIKLKKKVANATGYKVRVFASKKNAKKNKKAIVKKTINKNAASFTIKSKKLKKKKLFLRVSAFRKEGAKIVSEKWSAVKKVKIK